MERCPIRIGLAIAGLCLAASGSGCKSLGLGGPQDDQASHPAFYDEFFNQSDELDDPAALGEGPSRLFKRNRLPGGWSSEARDIERGSFNIY